MGNKSKQIGEHHDGVEWDMKSVSHFRELAMASKPDGHSDRVANKEGGDFSAEEDGNG